MNPLERHELYLKRGIVILVAALCGLFTLIYYVRSLTPTARAAIKAAGGPIYLLTSVIFGIMITTLFIGLVISIYCGTHYFRLRAQAQARARERIETARRNGYHITKEIEFIFYNYEYLHSPGEPDSPEMAAFLSPPATKDSLLNFTGLASPTPHPLEVIFNHDKR
jgi:hypothetical protein